MTDRKLSDLSSCVWCRSRIKVGYEWRHFGGEDGEECLDRVIHDSCVKTMIRAMRDRPVYVNNGDSFDPTI